MLITKSDITNRQVSVNLRDEDINQHIEDAERMDLRPLLGEEFYQAISSETEGGYDDLLNGSNYTFNSKSYSHPGLKRVLEDYSFARYVLFGSQKDTSFGFVEKSTQDSTHIDWSRKKATSQNVKDSAFQLWKDVERFLNRKKDDYPIWKAQCGSEAKGRVRFSKIS